LRAVAAEAIQAVLVLVEVAQEDSAPMSVQLR
jgi:hypothetical protein